MPPSRLTMELASGTYVNREGYPKSKAKPGRLEKADVIKIIDDASSAEENAVIAAPKLTFLSGISWRRIARIAIIIPRDTVSVKK